MNSIFSATIALSADPEEEKYSTNLLFNATFEEEVMEAEQMSQKRLKFNQYFESWLAKSEVKKEAEREERLKTRVGSVLLHKTGYDSNTFFNTARKGDMYQQEKGSVNISKRHEGFLGIFGQGIWSGDFSTGFKAYGDHDLFDSQQHVVGGAFQGKVNDRFTLDASYDFRVDRYIRLHSLTQKSHSTQYALSWDDGGRVRYRAFVNQRFKYYTHRRSLTPFDTSSAKMRKDASLETGIKTTVYPSKSVIYSATASWMRNDSTDQFHDFNDYESVKIRGFVLWKLNQNWKWVGFGGWTFKEYDDRRISFTSVTPERDISFYLGNELTYSVIDGPDLIFSYSYNQNGSNLSTQEYSTYSISSGVRYRL